MRGFIVLLLSIAIAVVAFIALRHGSGASTGQGKDAPVGTFSREHPGDHVPEEVLELEPKVVLVRGADAWRGRVDIDPPAGITARRVEVLGPTGSLIVGADIVEGVDPGLSFSVPLHTSGSLVAQVLYDTGEVWSFSARL